MKRATFLGLMLVIIVGGCPEVPGTQQQTGLMPEISISSTRGPAPLRISVSGASSTSDDTTITAYSWNFADQAAADTITASHLFSAPGRYLVTLTVTDDVAAQASATVVVQVQGTETPTAVIVNDVSSGPAPLNVRFDGTQSSVSDDTITDRIAPQCPVSRLHPRRHLHGRAARRHRRRARGNRQHDHRRRRLRCVATVQRHPAGNAARHRRRSADRLDIRDMVPG